MRVRDYYIDSFWWTGKIMECCCLSLSAVCWEIVNNVIQMRSRSLRGEWRELLYMEEKRKESGERESGERNCIYISSFFLMEKPISGASSGKQMRTAHRFSNELMEWTS